MISATINSGYSERLEHVIELARRDEAIALSVSVYRSLVKQLSQSEATDDLPEEKDMCLFMADFKSMHPKPGHPAKITKVYAICSINESEVNDRTMCHIANQRLDGDYRRLREAGVTFETAYF